MIKIVICRTFQYDKSEGFHVIDPDEKELSQIITQATESNLHNKIYIHCISFGYAYHFRACALRILLETASNKDEFNFVVIDPSRLPVDNT